MFTVSLKKIFKVGEALVFLVENWSSLISIDLHLALSRLVVLSPAILLLFFGLVLGQFAFLRANKALVKQVFISEFPHIAVAVSPLTFNVVLNQASITHLSQWSHPIQLSSS